MSKKTILPDILPQIRLQNAPHHDLLTWVKYIDSLYPQSYEWLKNGYIAWRALSGIFASNAQGSVSFMIGQGVSKIEKKVFAVTEIHVLDRNPNVDAVTKDAIQYYLRCVRTKQADISMGIIHG